MDGLNQLWIRTTERPCLRAHEVASLAIRLRDTMDSVALEAVSGKYLQDLFRLTSRVTFQAGVHVTPAVGAEASLGETQWLIQQTVKVELHS